MKFFCSSFKVTPEDYQPPGFKEGVCDRLWFEGIPVHFKVGEVNTAFHSLRVRVSVEQGQVEKLQKGNYVKDSKQGSPEGETIKVERGKRVRSTTLLLILSNNSACFVTFLFLLWLQTVFWPSLFCYFSAWFYSFLNLFCSDYSTLSTPWILKQKQF